MDQQTEELDRTEIYCANNPEHIVESKPNRTQRDGLTDSSSMLAWKHFKRLFDIQSVFCVYFRKEFDSECVIEPFTTLR